MGPFYIPWGVYPGARAKGIGHHSPCRFLEVYHKQNLSQSHESSRQWDATFLKFTPSGGVLQKSDWEGVTKFLGVHEPPPGVVEISLREVIRFPFRSAIHCATQPVQNIVCYV